MLTVSVGSFLIFLLIVIYIFGAYEDSDHVMVGAGPAASEGEEETNYETQDKGEYVALVGGIHILNTLLYLAFFFIARFWIKKNEEW